MKSILLILTIIIAAVITGLVLIQGKGGGLGSAWGGGGEMFQTRRGIEKLALRMTVVMVVLFAIISVVNLFVK